MQTAFLILAAAITLIAIVPYIRDMLRHKTKPNLVSWITWTLLTGIATSAALSAGEYAAAIFTGAATLATTVIVLLGVRHGYVRYTKFEAICQIAAIVGILLWQLLDSPAVAVMMVVIVDFVGSLPTVRHAWLKPSEETWETYSLGALGGLLIMGSFSEFNWVNMPYAVYIVFMYSALTAIILYRRSVARPALRPAPEPQRIREQGRD